MKKKWTSYTRWTFDMIWEKAQKYHYRVDWYKHDPNSYAAARRRGQLDIFAKHMHPNRRAPVGTEKYKQRLEKADNGVVLTEPYTNAHAKTKHRCTAEGHEWLAVPYSQEKRGCPVCAGFHWDVVHLLRVTEAPPHVVLDRGQSLIRVVASSVTSGDDPVMRANSRLGGVTELVGSVYTEAGQSNEFKRALLRIGSPAGIDKSVDGHGDYRLVTKSELLALTTLVSGRASKTQSEI